VVKKYGIYMKCGDVGASVWKSGPVRFFAPANKDQDQDQSWYIQIVQKTGLQPVRTGPAKDRSLGPVGNRSRPALFYTTFWAAWWGLD